MSRTNSRRKIVLSSYGTMDDMIRLRNDVFGRFRNKIFEIKGWEDLVFESLRQIKGLSRGLDKTIPSLDHACTKVLAHFQLDGETDGELYWEKEGDILSFEGAIKNYILFVLRLKHLPHDTYSLLASNVREHLDRLNKIIQRYETDSYISKYISTNEQPRDHEHRTKFDFYQRCIREREVIINYQLNGVKSRAIQKATNSPWGIGMAYKMQERYMDFPYRFGHYNSEEFFDLKQIDTCGHRVRNFPIKEAKKLEKQYLKDKEEFYSLYFQQQSPAKIFQSLKFYLAHLPLKKNRASIFDELEKLFNEQRWLSFYALALPQVEGLFTEMETTIFSKVKGKSLSDKVDNIRPFHDYSEFSFDYYQYIVPVLRNRFMHSGYDEISDANAYDILTDLEHLINIFYQLNDPIVKIKAIHVKRNAQYFISFEEFAQYFNLLNQLKQPQKEEYKTEIEQFAREFLTLSCDIEYICNEVIQGLPSFVDDIVVNLGDSISSKEDAERLRTMPLPEVLALVDDEGIRNRYSHFFIFHSSKMDYLEKYDIFVKGVGKHLPSLNPVLLDSIGDLRNRVKVFIKNLFALRKRVEELST